MNRYDNELSVSTEDIELELRGHSPISWLDFWLNPRRLRGSDFLIRWSQGSWSEERLIEAVCATEAYFALPYGPSSVAPDTPREHELYFERLESAGLGSLKRPDLLIFRKSDDSCIREILHHIGGLGELPFISENDERLRELLSIAIVAVECENSLWKAQSMPKYGQPLRPQRRLKGQAGLPKNAIVPNVILKEEDLIPLQRWQQENGVEIHIWHAFYDMAYGISLNQAQMLIRTGQIDATRQTFQASSGQTTHKRIYKIYYHHAYLVGESVETPELVAACIEDKNGHILPYVRFSGGRLALNEEAYQVLNKMAQTKKC